MSAPSANAADHFAVMGLPRAYEVDAERLRQRYLELSRAAHPDAAGSAAADSNRRSAALNEARRVLSDPLLRAEHLLALCGGEDAASNRTVPPEVLSSTLELREELEAAQAAGDASAIQRIRTSVQAEYDARLERIFQLASQLPGSEALRSALRIELNALKYQQRMLEQIEGSAES